MNGTVVAAVGVSSGTALLVTWQSGTADKRTASLRIVAAAFLLGAALSAVNGVAPGVASGLAWLIILSALLVNTPAISRAIAAATGG